MRWMLVVLLALAVSAAARAETQPGFYEAVKLQPAASFVASKRVTVECARTQYEWTQYVQSEYGGDVNGATVPGATTSRLAPTVCTNLLRWLRGKRFVRGFAPSLLVVVHEAIHARGMTGEGETDCAAVHEMPRVAVRYFKVKPGRELRAVMAAAWAYRATEPPVYRTAC